MLFLVFLGSGFFTFVRFTFVRVRVRYFQPRNFLTFFSEFQNVVGVKRLKRFSSTLYQFLLSSCIYSSYMMYEICIEGCDFAWVFHGNVNHEPIPVVVKNYNRVTLPDEKTTYSITGFNLDKIEDKPCTVTIRIRI